MGIDKGKAISIHQLEPGECYLDKLWPAEDDGDQMFRGPIRRSWNRVGRCCVRDESLPLQSQRVHRRAVDPAGDIQAPVALVSPQSRLRFRAKGPIDCSAIVSFPG